MYQVALVGNLTEDPELKKELLLRASRDGVSVSEVIREALRTYVQAS